MRRAWTIAKRDLEDALRNSTLLLILIGPVLCSVLFFRLSNRDDFGKPTLGVIGSRQEGVGLVMSTADAVVLQNLDSVEQAKVELSKGNIDGYVELDPELSSKIQADEFPTLELHVVESESLRTRLLERALEEAGRTVAAQELPLDLVVDGQTRRKGKADWAQGMLPSWLVFTAMSGLMFCSASFIEEKDHGTLLGVLTAPVSMVELWIGKVGSGVVLSFLSTLAVLLGNGIIPSAYLLLHLMVGCLAFAGLGVLVGMLSANGATANAATSTLFMVIYIPLALQEMSVLFQRIASLTPAFYLQRGTRFLMDEQVLRGLTDMSILFGFALTLALLGLWVSRRPERILQGT